MVPPRRTVPRPKRDLVILTVIAGLIGLLGLAWGFVILDWTMEWGMV